MLFYKILTGTMLLVFPLLFIDKSLNWWICIVAAIVDLQIF